MTYIVGKYLLCSFSITIKIGSKNQHFDFNELNKSIEFDIEA